MRLVAVDPGLRPGVVELDWATGHVLRASASLPDWLFDTPWDMAATELQWIYPQRPGAPRAARPEDILKLAFRAGFTLACIPAARSLAILPQDWRTACGYGSGLTKEQVQKKIANNLTAAERAIIVEHVPAARHGDVLDAIGIARAARTLAPKTKKYDWKL